MKNPSQLNLQLAGILISLCAVMINILFYTTTQVFGVQYLIPLGSDATRTIPMPFPTVIILTVAAAILATLFYWVLSKVAPRNILPPFLSVSLTALLVSFGGPMQLPGASLQTRLLLSAMHLLASGVILGGLLIYHYRFRKPASN